MTAPALDYMLVSEVMKEYGIPDYIWGPIAQLESSWNRYAVASTDKEHSIGLFQINIKAHPEYAHLDLTDPAQNARAIADLWTKRGVIEKALALPTYDQAAYVWQYGSRPAWSSSHDERIRQESLKYILQGSLYGGDYFTLPDLSGSPPASGFPGGVSGPGFEQIKLSLGERFARAGAWVLVIVVMIIAALQLFPVGGIPYLDQLKKIGGK